jgi:hypothetical protein
MEIDYHILGMIRQTQGSPELMAVWPYLAEVECQCELALAAADAMAASAARFWPIAESPSLIGDFFDYAQQFFCSAGIIAKVLYATNGHGRTRARQLRFFLDLGDESPLADSSIRNSLEHVDERIDKWVQGNPLATSYSHYGISRTTDLPSELGLRHYDSDADTFRLGRAEVRLQPVIEAIRHVQARVIAYRQQHECPNSLT